jgi:hypothetical protein
LQCREIPSGLLRLGTFSEILSNSGNSISATQIPYGLNFGKDATTIWTGTHIHRGCCGVSSLLVPLVGENWVLTLPVAPDPLQNQKLPVGKAVLDFCSRNSASLTW